MTTILSKVVSDNRTTQTIDKKSDWFAASPGIKPHEKHIEVEKKTLTTLAPITASPNLLFSIKALVLTNRNERKIQEIVKKAYKKICNPETWGATQVSQKGKAADLCYIDSILLHSCKETGDATSNHLFSPDNITPSVNKTKAIYQSNCQLN